MYSERLHEFKLYSLQRRCERYQITQNMVPNIDGMMGAQNKNQKLEHSVLFSIQHNPCKKIQ